MRKTRLFSFLALIIIFTLVLFAGCKKEDRAVSISLKDHDPASVMEMSIGGFDYGAYTVVVTYDSGRTEEIPLSENMITETDMFKFYQIGEHKITVSYAKLTCSFNISVKRSTFDDLKFSQNNVFTYDGKAHTVEVEGNIPANATVTYVGGNSFVNAGTYDVTAVVSCDGYVTVRLSTTVKIERAKYDMSGVKFEPKEFVYDGDAHSVSISGTLPAGVLMPTYTIGDKVTSSATEVGEYTVRATFTNRDPNYEPIPDMITTLKITPAEYVIKGVDVVFKREDGKTIGGNTKVYDGESVSFDLSDYGKLSNKISVAFSVLDENGKVISNSNKKTNIVNAGVYTVMVEFTITDGDNYTAIEPIVTTFTVRKAELDMTGVHFDSDVVAVDGKAHKLEVDFPKGFDTDAVEVTYEYYRGGVLMTDGKKNPIQAVIVPGEYTVKAIFTVKDANYNPIGSMEATLIIEA